MRTKCKYYNLDRKIAAWNSDCGGSAQKINHKIEFTHSKWVEWHLNFRISQPICWSVCRFHILLRICLHASNTVVYYVAANQFVVDFFLYILLIVFGWNWDFQTFVYAVPCVRARARFISAPVSLFLAVFISLAFGNTLIFQHFCTQVNGAHNAVIFFIWISG